MYVDKMGIEIFLLNKCDIVKIYFWWLIINRIKILIIFLIMVEKVLK